MALLSAAAGCARADDIVTQIAARCPSQPRTYSQVSETLRQLAATSDRVSLEVIGQSRRGRPLWLMKVTDPHSPEVGKMRLFIVARQHGNEPAGTTAVLALLEHFAAAPSSLEQAVLRHLELIAVPVANPDGAAANRRGNAAGVDLNRDWVRCSQPETQALLAAFRACRPHAVMDLHELPARSKRPSYQESFVETIGVSSDLPPSLSAYTTAISRGISQWMSRYGYGLNVFYDDPGDSLKLCHRTLGLSQGVAAFLCECKQGQNRPLRYRAGFHVLAALVVANYLVHNPLTPGAPEIKVAQQPAAESVSPSLPESETPATDEPATVAMDMRPAVDDQGSEAVAVVTEVQGGSQFAFVTIEVAGAMKVVSNQRRHRYLLRTGELEPGDYPIVARAYSTSDQVLASDEATVTVGGSAQALGR